MAAIVKMKFETELNASECKHKMSVRMNDDVGVKSLVHRCLLDHEGHEGQAMFVNSLRVLHRASLSW